MRKLFTSESVTEGHPDKLCDQVSDAVLDAILAQDPLARVACECATNTGLLLVMGEITTKAYVDIQQIARDTIREIGFDSDESGFNADSCGIITSIDEQSPDIAMGVNCALEGRDRGDMDTGAGDQGMMFGFACDETPELMPLPISLAHRLAKRLADVRKSNTLPFLLPDGKSQVTVEYEDDRPVRIDTVVVSAQHLPGVSSETIRSGIIDHVITPILPGELVDDETRILVNPTGRFVVGGPKGRQRTHRQKNHRRHLRRIRAPRRRRIQRQGRYQGGQKRGLRRPLSCQERGCRRPRKKMRNSDCLCHRCRAARLRYGRYVRHRKGCGGRTVPHGYKGL